MARVRILKNSSYEYVRNRRRAGLPSEKEAHQRILATDREDNHPIPEWLMDELDQVEKEATDASYSPWEEVKQRLWNNR